MELDDKTRDGLAAIALIMLARECDRMVLLSDGVDMCVDMGDFQSRFRHFLRHELPVNTEYGTQVVVSTRLLENLNTLLGMEFNPSLRAYEINAVIERTK